MTRNNKIIKLKKFWVILLILDKDVMVLRENLNGITDFNIKFEFKHIPQ